MGMIARPGSAGATVSVGVAARRRYLVRQALIAASVLAVVGGLFLVLTDRWRPAATPARMPPAVVLGVVAIVAVAALTARWAADLRSTAGRDLWSSADRTRVSEVKARLVQRMTLPPEDRDVAAALVRAETSGVGPVATSLEALLAVSGPAVVLVSQLPATEGVLAAALVVAVVLAPRWWLRRRLITGARIEGLLP